MTRKYHELRLIPSTIHTVKVLDEYTQSKSWTNRFYTQLEGCHVCQIFLTNDVYRGQVGHSKLWEEGRRGAVAWLLDGMESGWNGWCCIHRCCTCKCSVAKTGRFPAAANPEKGINDLGYCNTLCFCLWLFGLHETSDVSNKKNFTFYVCFTSDIQLFFLFLSFLLSFLQFRRFGWIRCAFVLFLFAFIQLLDGSVFVLVFSFLFFLLPSI